MVSKGSRTGPPKGAANLGVMYAGGQGVRRDSIEGYKWLTLARINRPNIQARWRARGSLDELKPHITKDQLRKSIDPIALAAWSCRTSKELQAVTGRPYPAMAAARPRRLAIAEFHMLPRQIAQLQRRSLPR